jgi:hypothetical protein
MHSSRKLQLEQATLMVWGFISVTFNAVGLALDQLLIGHQKSGFLRIPTGSVPI